MSAFLGPIHYWLYNKIQLQQDLVDEIISLSESKFGIALKETSERQYGETERRPLETVIDDMNIHGWLQTQVSIVENKLAYVVTELLSQKPEAMEALEALFEQKGREKRATLEPKLTAVALYRVINDSLLDGMPCDHANVVIEQGDHEVIWQRNGCVHKSYWDDKGGDIANFYKLREAWFKGFMSGQGEKFEKVDEITYKLQA